jgi:endonuclease/exonuclease/phosphatase family metal-dependent hydrolase
MAAVASAPSIGATWDGSGPEDFMFREAELALPPSAIVAGDFNFTPQHPEYPRVMGAGLVDAWRAAGNAEAESYPARAESTTSS